MALNDLQRKVFTAIQDELNMREQDISWLTAQEKMRLAQAAITAMNDHVVDNMRKRDARTRKKT